MSLLALHSIRKTYSGVIALDGVSFELRSGEVHCLLGENGAGKSTLMKILAGATRKDSGAIAIEGEEVEIASPQDALRCGIGMIYQDFKLVPELSVAENILLGHEPAKAGSPFIDRGALNKEARKALELLGETIPLNAPVRTLSIAQRQIVEIAKALSRNIRILALDEPSAALTDRELKKLFNIIRKLKSEGVGVIYISHRLEEIFEIGDRITVLRDGRHIHTCDVKDATRRDIIRWMVGRELEDEYPKVAMQRGKEILHIENLEAGFLRCIDLTLHQGEILGIAGLVGAGRSELARVVFGADQRTSGRIVLNGIEIHPKNPRDAIDLGIGLLTEDRNRFGLIMPMSVRENVSLANLAEVTSGLFLRQSKEHDIAQRFVIDLHIKTPSVEQHVEHLSGGNRQKVVLARWLFTKSRLLIFDEPTAGIDVGAKREIYLLINDLVKQGIGVIIISSDLPELLGLCDRIAVMHEGTITGILSREEATQERIMILATGGDGAEVRRAG